MEDQPPRGLWTLSTRFMRRNIALPRRMPLPLRRMMTGCNSGNSLSTASRLEIADRSTRLEALSPGVYAPPVGITVVRNRNWPEKNGRGDSDLVEKAGHTANMLAVRMTLEHPTEHACPS